MVALRRKWFTTNFPESSIVLVGFLLTILGLALRNSTGVAELLAAFGIALFVAGMAYVTAGGTERFRLTLAFGSLIAAQLLAFGGLVQWVGGITIGSIVVAITYSRM